MEAQNWEEQPSQELNIEQMDNLVLTMKEKRESYEKAKEESNRLYHLYAEAEEKVLNALTAFNKSKYFVDGIGTVSLVEKLSFTTPKENQDKAALFEFIGKKYGEETLKSMLSIHSQTLNSFANKEIEDDPGIKIPGLSEPTLRKELRFGKA